MYYISAHALVCVVCIEAVSSRPIVRCGSGRRSSLTEDLFVQFEDLAGGILEPVLATQGLWRIRILRFLQVLQFLQLLELLMVADVCIVRR